MRGDGIVWNALQEQHRMTESGAPFYGAALADLEDVVAANVGYTLEARASEILEGLAIPTRFHRSALSTLSGGFKLRVLLAQVLVGGVDVLLLDEPTNHLDILTIRWLEKFLAGYAGCAVIISHDQRFLDNVTTHTLDVDYGTLTQYAGNYSKAIVEKTAARERAEIEVGRAEDEIARKRAWVERFGAKNTKATQAQSRLKQIEKIEVAELAETSRRTPSFRVTPERPSGKEVLEIAEVSKAYGEKVVLRDVSLVVRAEASGWRSSGRTGSGRRRCCASRSSGWPPTPAPGSGATRCASGTYRRFTARCSTDAEATPLGLIEELTPAEGPTFWRSELGRVLFSGADVGKKVEACSPGRRERPRLLFALGTVAVEKPNVLILDEPTNHLDLESIHALVAALQAYAGTVVFVSHDRWIFCS